MSFANKQLHTELLRQKKILFAIVDSLQIRSRHNLLFKKVFDLTFVLTQRLTTIVNGDVKYFNTIDEAMSLGSHYDLVILQSVGNFILHYQFLMELDNFCRLNCDFFLLVFPPIPQIGGDWLALDFRMMVVNIDVWERLGYPSLEDKWGLVKKEPNNPNANIMTQNSFSNLQTGSLYKTLSVMHSGRGRKFLDTAVSIDLKFHLFSDSLHNCSLYIWPEIDSSRLYEGLMSHDESFVSNSEQKRWIHQTVPQSEIWIYNSEPYRFDIPLKYCETYFGPAAGFKYLDILSHNPNAEFIFYDRSEDSLGWIKALKYNWNGNDFLGYLSRQPEAIRKKFKYVNSSIELNQKLLFDDFGGEDGFKRLWQLFRSANARFYKCDLFNACDVRDLTSKTDALRPFFYYSNIFSTNLTLTLFSREEAEERYSDFYGIVKERFKNVIMHGADISGKWYYSDARK